MTQAIEPALREVLKTRVAAGHSDYRRQIKLVLAVLYLRGKQDAIRELREEMDGRAKSRDVRKRLFNETPSPERG